MIVLPTCILFPFFIRLRYLNIILYSIDFANGKMISLFLNKLHLVWGIEYHLLVAFLYLYGMAASAWFAHFAEKLLDGIRVFAIEIPAVPRGGAVFWLVGY